MTRTATAPTLHTATKRIDAAIAAGDRETVYRWTTYATQESAYRVGTDRAPWSALARRGRAAL